MNGVAGAQFTVRWVVEPMRGQTEEMIAIFGDTEEENDANGEAIFDQDIDMAPIAEVLDLSWSEWDIAKRGQNIGFGWCIIDTLDDIKFYYKEKK